MKLGKQIKNQILIYIIVYLLSIIFALWVGGNYTNKINNELDLLEDNSGEFIEDIEGIRYRFSLIDDSIKLIIDNQTFNRILRIDYKINYENHHINNSIKQNIGNRNKIEFSLPENMEHNGEKLSLVLGEVTAIYFLDSGKIKVNYIDSNHEVKVVENDYKFVENIFENTVPKFTFLKNSNKAKVYNLTDWDILEYNFYYDNGKDSVTSKLSFGEIESNSVKEIEFNSKENLSLKDINYKFLNVMYKKNDEIKNIVYYPLYNFTVEIDSDVQVEDFLE